MAHCPGRDSCQWHCCAVTHVQIPHFRADTELVLIRLPVREYIRKRYITDCRPDVSATPALYVAQTRIVCPCVRRQQCHGNPAGRPVRCSARCCASTAKRAGLSRTELASQISKSVSLIQAIELGQRVATAEVTDDLERALTADGALSRLREEIGDGLGYQPYPSWFEDWVASDGEPRTPLVRANAHPGLSADRGVCAGHLPRALRNDGRRDRREGCGPAETAGGPGARAAASLVGDRGRGRTAASGWRAACHVRSGWSPDCYVPASACVHTGHLVHRGAHRGLSAGAFIIADFEDAPPSATRRRRARDSSSSAAKTSKPLPIAGIRSYARPSRGRPRRRYWRKRRSHGHQ